MEDFKWSRESMKTLYDLRKLGVQYSEIAKKLDFQFNNDIPLRSKFHQKY